MKQLQRGVLVIALSLLTIAPAFGASPKPAPATPQNPGPNAVGQEKHPVMRKAIPQLERVKSELQNDASRDFDGHRANAVRLIDQAIQQLQQGIQSDKH